MIERYTLPAIGEVFTDRARMAAWLEVEILTVEALAKLGRVPKQDAEFVRANAPIIDQGFVDAVNEREMVTNHDLAAFVDVAQDRVGKPAGNWIHYGLTSSDVVDTALCFLIKKAGEAISTELAGAIRIVARRAEEFRDTIMAGRTHGMHAEPTTFGNKLGLWALQLHRDYLRLERAIEAISVGKLSGAVGTYSNIDPAVEKLVCEALGLTPVPATQVIARDRHGEYLYALATLASSIEAFATEVRHLQRTEVREAEEYFKPGQKGSSAMPHKRNPILSERLVGLARVMRGYMVSGLEDIALWHERDISHSSVERIVIPDASILAFYMVVKFSNLINGLVVYPERMRENLEASFGLVYSQSLLLALVESGLGRDEAYRIVQSAAREAATSRRPLREVLAEMKEVTLDDEVVANAFDQGRVLANTGLSVDAALRIPLLDENRGKAG